MNAARCCLASRNATSLATASLHAKDSGQRLPVHCNSDQIVACRDCVRTTAKPSKPSTAGRRTSECLGDEPQRAKATAPAPPAAALAGLAQQIAERREEGRVGRWVP